MVTVSRILFCFHKRKKEVSYRDKNLMGLGESLLSSIALNNRVNDEKIVDWSFSESFAGLSFGPDYTFQLTKS